MEDYSFSISPDARMDIKERLLYNILQELIKVNKKLDNKILNDIDNSVKDLTKDNQNSIKSYPINKNKKG